MEGERLREYIDDLFPSDAVGGGSKPVKAVAEALSEFITRRVQEGGRRAATALSAEMIGDGDDDGRGSLLTAALRSQSAPGGATLADARKEALCLVSKFVEEHEEAVAHYARPLWKACAAMTKRPTDSNAAREAAAGILIQLLQQQPDSLVQRLGGENVAREEMQVLLCKLQDALMHGKKKLSGGVKNAFLEVIIALMESYRSVVFEGDMAAALQKRQAAASWLLSESESYLRTEKTAKGVAGGLRGLVTALGLWEGDAARREASLRMACDRIWASVDDTDGSRYDVPRAALTMLHLHGDLFRGDMLERPIERINVLVAKLEHTNRDLRDMAARAARSMLRQLCLGLLEEPAGGGSHEELLQQVLAYLQAKLTQYSSRYDQWAGLVGLGAIAPAIRRFQGRQGVVQAIELSNTLVSRGGKTISSVSDMESNAIGREIGIVATQAALAAQLDIVPHVYMDYINSVIARLVQSYHDLWDVQQNELHGVLIRVLVELEQHLTCRQAVARQIVATLLDCTLCPPKSPADVLISRDLHDAEGEWMGWRIYRPCWIAVLDGTTTTAPLIQPEQEASAKELLYNTLLQAVSDMLSQLDLRYHTKRPVEAEETGSEGEETTEDAVLAAEIGHGLEAANTEHMSAFLNLSAFVCDVLPHCGAEWFKPWAYRLSLEIYQAAQNYELLSGNYRMLTTCLELCKAAGLLDLTVTEGGDPGGCLELYSLMAGRMLLAARRFKDELLGACLEYLLAVPIGILRLRQLVPAMQSALRLGQSYPPVAAVAMSALERWEAEAAADMQTILPDVVPFMGVYLEDSIALPGYQSDSRPTKRAKKRRRRQFEQSSRHMYEQLQLRVAAWLGRVGADVHLVISGAPEGSVAPGEDITVGSGGNELTRWGDGAHHLGLEVWWRGWSNSQAVWLDDLLPVIADLSEHSADRHTQASACEFLHAAALMVIGINAKAPSGHQDFDEAPSKLHTVMEKLFPVIVRLASTAEGSLARQLFYPMLMSIVHWLTKNARREAAETMALLDSLLLGVTDANSAAKREVCAEAMAEFLKWSAKHAGAGKSSQSVSNPESLLRRIFERLCHPEPYQRLGGATALCHCYRQLCQRELREVVSKLLLEALFFTLNALRMASADPAGNEAISLLRRTALRLGGLASRHASLLARHDIARTGPFQSLGPFLEWLWTKTSAPQRQFRAVCQRLLEELVVHMEEGDLMTGGSAAQAMELDSAGTEAPATQGGDDVLRDASRLRSWAEATLRADIGHGSGNEGMEGLASVRAAVPAWSGGEDVELWLATLCGGIEWCYWALDKGVLSVEELKDSQTINRATIDGPGASVALCHAVTSLPTFLQLLARENTRSSPLLMGCKKACSRTALHVLQLMAALHRQGQPMQAGGIDAASEDLHSFLAAALIAPSALGVHTLEGPLQDQMARDAKAVLEAASDRSHGTAAPELVTGVKDALETRFNALLQESDAGASGEVMLPFGSHKGEELIHGLSTLVYSPEAVRAVLPDRIRNSPELPLRLLNLASSLPMSAGQQQRVSVSRALDLALKLGLARERKVVLDKLLSSSGAAMYAAVPAAVMRWLLFEHTFTAPALCQAMVAADDINRQQAEVLLMGVLLALRKTGDPAQDGFLRSLVSKEAMRHFKALAQPGTPLVAQLKFVRVMAALLDIDTARTLSAAQSGSKILLEIYLALLESSYVPSGRQHGVALLLEMLPLLPQLLTLPADQLHQVKQRVQAVVDAKLLASPWDLRRGAELANHRKLLMCLLDVTKTAAQSGLDISWILLEALPSTLRHMGMPKGHRWQLELEKRLRVIVAAPWMGAAHPQEEGGGMDDAAKGRTWVEGLLASCWTLMTSTLGTRGGTTFSRVLLEFVMLPALRLAPAAQRLPLFESCLRHASPYLRSAPTEPTVFLHAAICRLLGILYLCVPYAGQLEASEAYAALGGNKAVAQYLRACFACDALPAPDHEMAQLKRQLRCTAFCAFVSLMTSTQSQAKFLERALDPVKSGGVGAVLVSLLDHTYTLPYRGGSPGLVPSYPGGPVRWHQTEAEALMAKLGGLAVGLPLPYHLMGPAPTDTPLGERPSLSRQIVGSQYSLTLAGASQRPSASQAPGATQASATQAHGSASLSATQRRLANRASLGSQGASQGGSQSEDDLSFVAHVQRIQESALKDESLEAHDALDFSPVMLPLVLLMERAAEMGAPAAGSEGPVQMPGWMQQLLDALRDVSAPRLVRLLVCKLLYHFEHRHQQRSKGRRLGGDTTSEALGVGNEFVNTAGPALLPPAGGEEGILQEEEEEEEDSDVPPRLSALGGFAGVWFEEVVRLLVVDAPESEWDWGLHPLLRGMVAVFLNWHAADGAALQRGTRCSQAMAERLVTHLVRVGHSSKDAVLVSASIELLPGLHCSASGVGLLAAIQELSPATRPPPTPGSHPPRYAFPGTRSSHLAQANLAASYASAGLLSGALPCPCPGLLEHLSTVLAWQRSTSTVAASVASAIGTYAALAQAKLTQPEYAKVCKRIKDEMNSLAFKQGTVAALGLFATAADAMTERHAELAPQLKSPVLGRISVAYGETQLKLVRVLRRCAQLGGVVASDLVVDLEPHLGSLLGQQSARVLGMELVADLLPAASSERAAQLVASHVVAYALQPGAPGVRACCQGILQRAWTYAPAGSPLRAEVLRPPLLALLGDEDTEIRAQAVEFWSREAAALDLCAHLCALLHDHHLDRQSGQATAKRFAEPVETSWLAASSVLLLKMAEEHDRFETSLFDHPLDECTFHDQYLDTEQAPSMSMSRSLFSELSSQSQASADVQLAAGHVRATQEATVGATLSMSLPVSSMRWLAQDKRAGAADEGHAGNSALGAQRGGTEAALPGQTGLLRGRKARNQAEARTRQRRLHAVQLTRKYRRGELPDIEAVSAASFLRPLAILAARDAQVASLCLSTIAEAALSRSAAAADGTATELHRAVASTFARKIQHPPMVACLQKLASDARWGIDVSVEHAADAAFSSSNFSLGAFHLEALLVRRAALGAAQAQRPRKRQRSEASGNGEAAGHLGLVVPPQWADAGEQPLEAWRRLAELYSLLGQAQLEHLVLLGRMAVCPALLRVLTAASDGKLAWSLRELDEKLIDALQEEAPNYELFGEKGVLCEEERDGCLGISYEERGKCLLALGKWQHLAQEARLAAEDEDGQLQLARLLGLGSGAAELRQELVPWLRGSLFQLRLSPSGGLDPASDSTLLQCRRLYEDAKALPGGEAALLGEAAKETALALTSGTRERQAADVAEYCIAAGHRILSRQWTQAGASNTDRRHRLLLDLQAYAEMQEALQLLKDGAGTDEAGVGRSLDALADKWARRPPSTIHADADSMMFTIHARCLLLTALGSLAPSQAERARSAQGRLLLQGVAKLRKGGHLDSARELLNRWFPSAQGGAESPLVLWQRAKLCMARAARWGQDDDLEELRDCVAHLGAGGGSSSPVLVSKLAVFRLQGSDYIAHRAGPGSKAEWQGKAWSAYLQATDVTTSETTQIGTSGAGSASLASASLKLALFCNSLLTRGGDAPSSAEAHPNDLAARAVRHFFAAMALGGPKGQRAALYVPRLLGLLDRHADDAAPGAGAGEGLVQAWADGCARVPPAVFLPWIPQLLCTFGRSGPGMVDALQGALERLAAVFPQQMCFPFNMSRAHFGPQATEKSQQLQHMLQLPQMEEFAAALNAMTYPLMRWQCHSRAITRAAARDDMQEALRVWSEEAWPDCLAPSVRQSGGRLNAAFAKTHKSKADAAQKLWQEAGRDQQKQGKRFLDAVKALDKAITDSAAKDRRRPPSRHDLSDFSHWFTKYSQLGTGAAGSSAPQELLDMPGVSEEACLRWCSQSPEAGVKAISFSSSTTVFASKQRPKRIRMFGDNFATYEYVVKGAEDIRVDQRVATLFRVMSGLLASDSAAVAEHLAGALRSFAVIPVTPSVGLLAFVPNTQPLLDSMQGGGGRLTPEVLASAGKQYAEGVSKLGAQGVKYDKVFTADNGDVADSLAQAQSLVPWDALRGVLLRVSGGPDRFIATRAAFTSTLAAISAAGYIAGIGDRHLQNFLLDKRTGEIVAIDFGYCFGTAAQVLTVPELMPFRMSRVMVGALAPFGVDVLRRPLEVALDTFRSARPVLEAILTVFMTEPLQEWQREAEVLYARTAKSSGVALGGDAAAEHIRLKVEHASWKLQGRHPGEVLLEELAPKHRKAAYWGGLRAAVEGSARGSGGGGGSEGISPRARVAQELGGGAALPTSELVTCLLDLATDPVVLGRTWQGWRPWL